MVKAQATEGWARLTAMKLKWVDVRKRLTSATTIASSGENNGAGKSLSMRTKRVSSRNTDVLKKKPSRNFPPMKEEVRKIGSRKVGQSMRRLLEGIDQVRELMIAQQHSTPIHSQCDAVIASLGGGDCDVPSPIQANLHLSKQIAACERGQAAQKSSVRNGRRSKCAADEGAGGFEPWRGLCKPSIILGQTREI